MNRGRNRSSTLEAILTSVRSFVLPIEPAKVEQFRTVDAIPAYMDFDLLLMRMEALQLDPSQVKAATPGEFRVLARVCDHCQCKLRCEHDLAYEAAGKIVAWENYCPNVFRLRERLAPQAI